MWLILYFVVFWVFTFAFILMRSLQKEEAHPQTQRARTRLTIASGIIKPIPAGLAALFVFLLQPSNSLFYPLMMVGLTLCLFGDIGMEIGLLPGIGLFMLAQASLTVAFLSQSIALGITPITILPLGIILVLLLVYFVLFMRYLLPGLGKYRVPVFIYALLMSAMLYASLLLWLTSGTLLGLLIVAGALSFVVSDSLIGVREFHQRFSKSVIKVSGTYYLAIFLLSLCVLVYLF